MGTASFPDLEKLVNAMVEEWGESPMEPALRDGRWKQILHDACQELHRDLDIRAVARRAVSRLQALSPRNTLDGFREKAVV